jgi:hypothetical protein
VKRLVALAAGVAGLWAVLRRRYRRPAPAVEEGSPANDLRAQLAESRAAEAAAVPDAEPAAPAAAESELEGRRRDVHERARQAMDELA